PLVSIPLSVLIILFLINAFNLIDGIDGLAGGLAFLASALLGTWFSFAGHVNSAIMCLAFCGSLLAFLYYNLLGGKNKIFMGDTGSLILGVFLAAMTIRFNELNNTAAAHIRFDDAPLFALALMIVPVTDTLRVFTIRLIHGRSPFSPDMNHFHHLLIKLGFSHIRSTCFLLAYTIGFIIVAKTFILLNIGIAISFPLLLGISFMIVGLIYRNSRAHAVVHLPPGTTDKPLAMVTFNILKKKELRSLINNGPARSSHPSQIEKPAHRTKQLKSI
ncbi:MAG: MraY family glycosyltransferase, partial [Mangrovibacterium sp.]